MNKRFRPGVAEMLHGEDDEVLKQLKDSKDRYRKIVQAAIGQWVRDFQNGQIKVETVEDLRSLIDLDIRLQRKR